MIAVEKNRAGVNCILIGNCELEDLKSISMLDLINRNQNGQPLATVNK